VNLVPNLLPKGALLIRRWSGHPLSMMQELDGSFDATMMIGYHARARSGASPLEHTFTGRVNAILVNGRPTSEFTFGAYAAAYHGVPVALISGDEGICAESMELCPGILTVPVKRGAGAPTISIHPAEACERIRQAAQEGLKRGFRQRTASLPDRFEIEIVFRRHPDAYAASFYPGASLADPATVRFETDDYFEALRAAAFLLRG